MAAMRCTRLGALCAALRPLGPRAYGLHVELLPPLTPPLPQQKQQRQLHATGSAERAHAGNVAVVLSGAGVYDGTELLEAASVLIHLSRGGAKVEMFAPNVSQMHVVDHSKGEPAMGETRNVLVESARIARGKVSDLAKLNASTFDAIIFPGGFGVAKNLSTFAEKGSDCKVNADVERVLKEFHGSKKPIGLCCIAPVLAARVLPGVEVSVGQESDQGGKWPHHAAAGAVKAMGAKHVEKHVTEVHVDTKNKVVTTPAFMCETDYHHIFDGIGAMVKAVLNLAKK
ncbi:ES1 protein homolog, mitochondrial-like isoform X1 [Lethenteron reissneri]|uniref:ES1 protein homolog, mitochondrial-like isoform X1 n=2 Tax=Lethenteron reissneri TaxID=7753 RepID=UPI002AB662B4|nr:ES1 protein homolog, mitochondrial-like isoform X1 [Lethenteron reissneri]